MSRLQRKLVPFGLGTPAALAKALRIQRQYAYQLLRGDSFGPGTAKKIGKAIGVPWDEVYSWPDRNSS